MGNSFFKSSASNSNRDSNVLIPAKKQFKIIMVGDEGVGKKSFLRRQINRGFTNNYQPPPTTLGVEFATSIVFLKDDSKVKLAILNHPGNKNFERFLLKQYFKNSQGVLLFFDLTNRETFDCLDIWLEKIRSETEAREAVVMLVGTKLDLVQEKPDSRQVSRQDANDFAKKFGLMYKETSAKSGENVNEAFQEFAEAINEEQKQSKPNYIVVENNSVKLDKGFCC